MCVYTKAAIVILVVLLVWLAIVKPMYEGFMDSTTTTFIPMGQPAYGLRGEPLTVSSVAQYYYPNNRNIRLSDTNNWMYQTYGPVNQEPGFSSCQKTPCPQVDGYDKQDTCWSCPATTPKFVVPELTTH